MASLVVTVGDCSWWSTADRGGPMSAFRACAESSMWDSAPLPEPRRGRQEVRCATLTVSVDYADPGRGFLYDMIDSLEGKRSERGEVDVDDVAFVIGCNDSAPAARLRGEVARLTITYPCFGEYGSRWLFRCTFWTVPHPVPPIPDTVTASPVLVIATDADPSTPHSGGVAIARALGPSANLLTVSGVGHTASGRSPCVAEQVTLYLVELRVPGGPAC